MEVDQGSRERMRGVEGDGVASGTGEDDSQCHREAGFCDLER